MLIDLSFLCGWRGEERERERGREGGKEGKREKGEREREEGSHLLRMCVTVQRLSSIVHVYTNI